MYAFIIMETVFYAISQRVIRPNQDLGAKHRVESAAAFMKRINRANAGTKPWVDCPKPIVCVGNNIQLPVCSATELPLAPLLSGNVSPRGSGNILE